jgi:hypothetical protein
VAVLKLTGRSALNLLVFGLIPYIEWSDSKNGKLCSIVKSSGSSKSSGRSHSTSSGSDLEWLRNQTISKFPRKDTTIEVITSIKQNTIRPIEDSIKGTQGPRHLYLHRNYYNIHRQLSVDLCKAEGHIISINIISNNAARVK